MFNIFDPIKKIIGFDKKKTSTPAADSPKENLFDKAQKIPSFLNKKIDEAVTEYGVIREKMKDLRKTNYDLGMKHLENGHIAEAIFRFKILKKFCPDHYDAYYQLAYCLILTEKFDKAEEVIAELLQKNPDYENKVMILLGAIDNAKRKKLEEAEAAGADINKDGSN